MYTTAPHLRHTNIGMRLPWSGAEATIIGMHPAQGGESANPPTHYEINVEYDHLVNRRIRGGRKLWLFREVDRLVAINERNLTDEGDKAKPDVPIPNIA